METTAALEPLSKTILLVDDEEPLLDLVSMFLRSQYNVIPANCGTQALQRSGQFKGEIHLLLADSQMPGLNGSDLAVQITLQRPDIKILLMSGSREGLNLRAGWYFLAKPFDVSQINEVIADIFSSI
jgi:DNA-binding NtrC family response regulator